MIGIIGLLATAFFFIRKEWRSLEKILLVLIGLSFVVLALSSFFIFNYAYYGYYGLMLISTIGILLLSIREQKGLLISILVSIWMFGFIFAALNFPYHYEFLMFKLLVALPLTIYLLISKKTEVFDKVWISLYLISLSFEIHNSYFS